MKSREIKKPLILLLFTASYPYDGQNEQTFLDLEVSRLAIEFEKVILVPKEQTGDLLSVPNNVHVDNSYSVFIKKKYRVLYAILKTFFSSLFWQDFLNTPLIWSKPSALIRLFSFVVRTYLTEKWFHIKSATSGYSGDMVIFYTYWLDAATMGGCLVKERSDKVAVISRAHGYDLYEERYLVPYLPCRLELLTSINSVFPDSIAGVKYLQSKYPEHHKKIKEAFLGVRNSGFITSPSSDNVFRIVSCAIIRPVKRIDLLLKGIVEAAKRYPEQLFEWHHFGEGEKKEDLENLQTLVSNDFPPNATAFFPGYPGQEELFNHYKNNPVDIFVNVSESEGTPVSIMEAVSCGIPIIATEVGGNPEIASEKNGILLNANPTPNDIANAFFEIFNNEKLTLERRKESYKTWQEKYDAEKNYKLFASEITKIVDGYPHD